MERGVALPPGDYRDDPTLTTTANNALALDMTVPADGRRPPYQLWFWLGSSGTTAHQRLPQRAPAGLS
jgi:hypothetical protein